MACLVAVWLIYNEIISILENINDIGTDLTPFLLKLVKKLKSQVESKADQALPAEAASAVSNLATGTQPNAEVQKTASIVANTSTADNPPANVQQKQIDMIKGR